MTPAALAAAPSAAAQFRGCRPTLSPSSSSSSSSFRHSPIPRRPPALLLARAWPAERAHSSGPPRRGGGGRSSGGRGGGGRGGGGRGGAVRDRPPPADARGRPPPASPPAASLDSPRAEAVRQLLRVEESGAFVGLVSGGVDDTDPFFEDDEDDDEDDDNRAGFNGNGSSSNPNLTRRQQRVVKDLVAGVTRWQRRLDFVLSQLLAPPASSNHSSSSSSAAGGNVGALDPPMRAILRLALFELTERRLPPHALGDYVALARRMSGQRVGGNPDRAAAFCNGVLRSAARQWESGQLPLPERALARELGTNGTNASARREAVRALAAVHSHPAWMVGRWVREWGPEQAEALLRRNNERPVHCLRASRPGGAAELLQVLEREARAFQDEEEEDWDHEEQVSARTTVATTAAAAPAAPKSAALAAAAALSAAAAAAVSGSAAPPPPKRQPQAAPLSPPPPPPPPAAPPTLQQQRPQPQAALSPFLPDDFVRLPAEGGLLQAALRSGLIASGLCTVQDEATGLVVRLALKPQRGETILDACAAPGGKALYTSALLQGQGVVVAADASAPRLRALEGTAQRLAGAGPAGLKATASLVVGPSGDLRDFQRAKDEWMMRENEQQRGGRPPLPELFDAVLLDAPCSGTGVLSKRADLRWRRTQEQLEKDLPQLQDELLDAAASLVKPGGRLVYATCSVERDENERRVKAFLARAAGRGFEVEPLVVGGDADDVDERQLSLWRSALDGPYLRLLPHVHGTDGAFACRLRRRKA